MSVQDVFCHSTKQGKTVIFTPSEVENKSYNNFKAQVLFEMLEIC